MSNVNRLRFEVRLPEHLIADENYGQQLSDALRARARRLRNTEWNFTVHDSYDFKITLEFPTSDEMCDRFIQWLLPLFRAHMLELAYQEYVGYIDEYTCLKHSIEIDKWHVVNHLWEDMRRTIKHMSLPDEYLRTTAPDFCNIWSYNVKNFDDAEKVTRDVIYWCHVWIWSGHQDAWEERMALNGDYS